MKTLEYIFANEDVDDSSGTMASVIAYIESEKTPFNSIGSWSKFKTVMKNLLEDIALLTMVGAKIIVVHGGGKEISKTLDKMGLKSEFYEGYRVTGDDEMNVVEMVLSGSVNKKIVERFSQSNISAVGVSGTDGNILKATPKYINGKSLGRVGDISRVDTTLIDTLFKKRLPLYRKYADITLCAETLTLEDTVEEIIKVIYM